MENNIKINPMKPIYIILTLPEYREEFRVFCESEWIRILDPSFLALPKSTYAVVRLSWNTVDDWITAYWSSDFNKLLPPQSCIMWWIDFRSFYKSLPKQTMSNYYQCAVTQEIDWETKEVIPCKTVFAKSEKNLERELIRDIPKDIDIDTCEIHISQVF